MPLLVGSRLCKAAQGNIAEHHNLRSLHRGAKSEGYQKNRTTDELDPPQRGFQHKFTSNRLVNTWALGTGNWCLAQILRDAEDPDNCAAAETKTRGGYCEQDVPLTPITC
ncbi:hypothetical protein ACHAQA_002474 [Verticillium albo-atrum]